MTNEEMRQILEADLSNLSPRERALKLARKIQVYRQEKPQREKHPDETDAQRAWRMACNVSFLVTREERQMYAGAIFAAIKWGRKIDALNRASRKSIVEMAGGERPENNETMEERSERIKANFERSIKLQRYFKDYK